MDAPAPFTHATPSPCRLAWTGGSDLPPEWRYSAGTSAVDRAGFHALVRAAGLPIAELRRMGFKDSELAEGLADVPVERAARLLGRIAWDAIWGAAGDCWHDASGQQMVALSLGLKAVRAWFT